MGFSPDRLKAAFFALLRASVPRLDYYTTYRARVVQFSDDGLIHLQADDPRVPPMGGVPLRHGLPGVSVTVPAGSFVLVGWSGGDPSQPYCALWEGGEPTIQLTINAGMIFLAGKPAAEGGELIPVLDGVVHGQGVDPFTGAPYFALGNTSKVVTVKR